MLTFTSSTKIFAYVPATDMRKGFSGLSAIVREEFQAEAVKEAAIIPAHPRRKPRQNGNESLPAATRKRPIGQ